MPLWLALVIVTASAAVAGAQHPATVFPGTPSLPGMSAPIAFPTDPDPGGMTSRPPVDVLGDHPNRQRQIMPGTTRLDLDRFATDQALRTRLLLMLNDDRRVTRSTEGHSASGDCCVTAAIDQQNLVLLKAIVAEHGWPTIALAGAAASQAASAILLHTADQMWQDELAPELQRLVDTGQVFGADIAEIVDGLLVRSGRPQKFGTQFEFRDGGIVIRPVQNLRRLDQWRGDYLLSAVSALRRSLESTYHLTVTGPAESHSTR